MYAENHATIAWFSVYKKRPKPSLFIGTGREAPFRSDAFDLNEAALEGGAEFYWRLLELKS